MFFDALLLCRSLVIGIVISADYKISLWGLDEVGIVKFIVCLNMFIKVYIMSNVMCYDVHFEVTLDTTA